jgi:hypothetical protein
MMQVERAFLIQSWIIAPAKEPLVFMLSHILVKALYFIWPAEATDIL